MSCALADALSELLKAKTRRERIADSMNSTWEAKEKHNDDGSDTEKIAELAVMQGEDVVSAEKTDDDPGRQTTMTAQPKVPPPPNGGYGWVCTVCSAIINGHTWGLNSSYGVFLAHYLANNTFPGATALEYAFVGSLSISCAMLIR